MTVPSTETSPDPDDYGEITQADLDRATYRFAGKAMEQEDLEARLRWVIREEMGRFTGSSE